MLRNKINWAIPVAAALACGLLLAGCDTGAPSVSASTDEVAVKGTVKIGGKPATGGEIMFDPSNVKRKFAGIRSAKIGEDGTYTVTTLYGGNKISIRTPQIDVSADLAPSDDAKGKPVPKSNVDKAAAKLGGGTLHPNVKKLDIEDGDQPIDIEL
ncbi:hypothetical protein [Paludisphaera rhizosphaerae]|uniref:hypothetical protein n=1 Tax=Paludisphaera rhizosphaerae TaxID=2711216 RepID=UPI0013EB4D38|nr:hypothetical protein [Paludisphaera rhizosphaerae]